MKHIVRLVVLIAALSVLGVKPLWASTCETDWSGNSYTPFSTFMTTDYGNPTYTVSSYGECDADGSSEVYWAAYDICTARGAAHTWEVWVDAYIDSSYVNSYHDSGNCNGINDYNTLTLGQELDPDDTISSPNSSYTLWYQLDGNLVLYQGSSALWATGTNPSTPGKAIMQLDGNFVVYNSSNSALWATGTNPSGSYLAIRNDGYIAVYSSNGVRLWRN